MKRMRALLLLLIFTGCAGPALRTLPPELRQGRVIYDAGSQRPSEQTLNHLMERLQQLVAMVHARDWSGLPALVSKRKGIYVDLKGYRSYDQLLADIKDRESYLYVFYHDTAVLRRHTQDQTQISVRDLLLSTRSLTADIFMEVDDVEAEMELHLDDAPEKSFRLNHPVFILEEGQWKVYRLF